MTKEELIDAIQSFIDLDGDIHSDGEVVDMIQDLLIKEREHEK